MRHLFLTETVQRAYLPCQDAAGNEPVARQFAVDDQKSIWSHEGSCAKQRSKVLRKLRTARLTQLLYHAHSVIKQPSCYHIWWQVGGVVKASLFYSRLCYQESWHTGLVI